MRHCIGAGRLNPTHRCSPKGGRGPAAVRDTNREWTRSGPTGSFASRRSTIHRSGAGTVAGSGSASSRMMAVMVSAALPRGKARRPVASSYKTSPNENWSDCAREVRAASRLLRTHVSDGAERGAGLRTRHGAGSIVVRVVRGYDLRQAEVENLDTAIARNENVIGLRSR